ncbi:MAG TPA: hypothetical protein VM364_18605 [Vicinamibacterales bacterium]|nr:hypothetical protein [Vicinamibacterales bacterium]
MGMRRQRPVKGGRQPLPACVIRQIHDEVDRTARKFNVSRSFVIAVALGHTFGIEVEEYRQQPRQLRRVK